MRHGKLSDEGLSTFGILMAAIFLFSIFLLLYFGICNDISIKNKCEKTCYPYKPHLYGQECYCNENIRKQSIDK